MGLFLAGYGQGKATVATDDEQSMGGGEVRCASVGCQRRHSLVAPRGAALVSGAWHLSLRLRHSKRALRSQTLNFSLHPPPIYFYLSLFLLLPPTHSNQNQLHLSLTAEGLNLNLVFHRSPNIPSPSFFQRSVWCLRLVNGVTCQQHAGRRRSETQGQLAVSSIPVHSLPEFPS